MTPPRRMVTAELLASLSYEGLQQERSRLNKKLLGYNRKLDNMEYRSNRSVGC